jgi:hypothetical protein
MAEGDGLGVRRERRRGHSRDERRAMRRIRPGRERTMTSRSQSHKDETKRYSASRSSSDTHDGTSGKIRWGWEIRYPGGEVDELRMDR